jgi:hypothetical protein
MGVHLTGMHLMGIHFMGMYFIGVYLILYTTNTSCSLISFKRLLPGKEPYPGT